MNRRQFIKVAAPVVALPAIAITCKYEDDEKGPEKEALWKRWDYRVYCYEREQGEWVFSQNVRGSFNYQREYMTFEESNFKYCGWMDQGKLHFATLDDATDFVDCHVRTKDDVNLIDSIYDIYFISREEPKKSGEDWKETEIKVAHYWFNGDTGRQVSWQSKQPYQDWSKMECS